ncbi:hypothetical protein D3C71_1893180 [compost metagenome]
MAAEAYDGVERSVVCLVGRGSAACCYERWVDCSSCRIICIRQPVSIFSAFSHETIQAACADGTAAERDGDVPNSCCCIYGPGSGYRYVYFHAVWNKCIPDPDRNLVPWVFIYTVIAPK